MRVGAYGSDTRLTYGVLGDATNMAARLMTQAEPGQICVSAHVAAQVAPRFDVTPLGLRSFKGKSEPQQVFAILGTRTQLLTFSAAPATPLLGRNDEMAQLLRLADTAAAGAGVVARLEGEAGAGKSHLTSHFVRAAAHRGLQVVSAACQSTAQNSAYFAAQQFMSSLLDIQPALDASTTDARRAQVRQVEQALQAQDPKWLLRLPLLGDLLGLPIEDNPTTAAFDARMRQEALAALVIDIVRSAPPRSVPCCLSSRTRTGSTKPHEHWCSPWRAWRHRRHCSCCWCSGRLVPNTNPWPPTWPKSLINSVSG